MPFVGGGSVYGLFQMLLNDLNFIYLGSGILKYFYAKKFNFPDKQNYSVIIKICLHLFDIMELLLPTTPQKVRKVEFRA